MAVTKITYENKEAIQNDASVANKSKVTDDDMNEIKKVVNNNADEVTGMQENIEDLQDGQGSANADITSLKNRVNTLESNVSNLENNKVDKIEGKSLSTEDFTTELKTKLEGLNNYDDTEIKEDISDLQEEQQTQNTNIENLQTNDTKQDKLISKLKNALINAETEEAKSIHVTDANRFGSLEVLGNVEQETREGYNFLNITAKNKTSDGVTMTINKDDSVTFNGTATAQFGGFSLLASNTTWSADDFPYNKDLTLKCEGLVEGINFAVAEGDESGDWIRNILSIDGPNNKVTGHPTKQANAKYIRVNFTVLEGAILNNVTIYPMLYKGTDEKEFEQYGPSPSPAYPSPVVCLGSNTDGSFKGSTEITNFNKNHIKTENSNGTKSGINYNIQNGIVQISGTNSLATTNNINLNQYQNYDCKEFPYNQNVTFSCEGISDLIGKGDVAVGEFDATGKWIRNLCILSQDILKTFNISKLNNRAKYVRASIAIYANQTVNCTLKPMLELGNVKTDFASRQENNYILPIQQEMLSEDYFIKESDGWKEVHSYPKKIFDGTENINLESLSQGNNFHINIPDALGDTTAPVYSNCFMYYNGLLDKNYSCRISGSKNLNLRCNEKNTVEEFKQMLADKYNTGNPVYAFYKAETPTKLICTEEQSAVLEELSNMDLFEGVNNIITAEDIALLKLNYVADSKTYINNKIDEKLANINQQILEIAGGN